VLVDFAGRRGPNGQELGDIGAITSLDAPHRIFDAIVRDSDLNGTKFTDTDEYKQLLLARTTNALQVFRLSPTSLVFGVWNSTGEGGGVGAKFARCIVSEIVGVGAAEGQKAAVRIDPLGIRATVKVVGGPLDWSIATGAKGEKNARPSEINHSTIDYALHTAVITCAGLRRLKFPGFDQAAAQTVLAALALVALTEQDLAGYPLRSRCDLIGSGKAPFEIVRFDGSTEEFELDANGAASLLREAVAAATASGLPWDKSPIRLTPQHRLVELVALSRAKALAGESEGEGA
jgi:CRISPR-associated protein Csb1